MKILFVQRTIQPPGGGNTVAIWIIEALKRDHQITVLTFYRTNLAEINRYYGTALDDSEITLRCVHPWLTRLIELDPDPISIQPLCCLMRICRMWRGKFDVCISADNEIDFGCRGVQYVHYPYIGDQKFRDLMQEVDRGAWRALLKGIYRPWMLISGFSIARMQGNVTLTNSHWTASVIRERYEIESEVVYPPTSGDFPIVNWNQKENGFVCLGRFDPCKRTETIVEILDKVRHFVPDIHLHIIGSHATTNPADECDYREKIFQLAADHSEWISIHENLPREDIADLLSRHRYGIHAHEAEHFGIAIAEMVSAGCITFVPDDGGQVEIVEDTRLIYRSIEDAVQKIVHVLKNSGAQQQLSAKMECRRAALSNQHFIEKIQKIVGMFQPVRTQ